MYGALYSALLSKPWPSFSEELQQYLHTFSLSIYQLIHVAYFRWTSGNRHSWDSASDQWAKWRSESRVLCDSVESDEHPRTSVLLLIVIVIIVIVGLLAPSDHHRCQANRPAPTPTSVPSTPHSECTPMRSIIAPLVTTSLQSCVLVIFVSNLRNERINILLFSSNLRELFTEVDGINMPLALGGRFFGLLNK